MKATRNIYISNVPVEEAMPLYLKTLHLERKTEEIKVSEALFRTTSEAVFAKISSPHYPSAAMDGIAVVAKATYGASEKTPLTLVEGKNFDYINTGNVLPTHYDAVIMIEDVNELNSGNIQIIMPAYPWQHIRPVGEDMVQGEMILPSVQTIRPIDLGALLCGGVEHIQVFSKVKVGILPTGNEIVQEMSALSQGKIMDSNSKVFEGMVLEVLGIPQVYPPVMDNPELIKAAILKGIEENDILIINAGSSAGSKDYTADLIRQLGEVIIHGIAMKPGKPTILGKIGAKAVIGIPGYPVSAYFSFETFVKPILEWYAGQKSAIKKVEAILTQRIVSSLKHEELVRMTLGEVDGQIIGTPLNRGAGNTMSLVRADGVLTVPRLSEGIEAGEKVEIRLLKPLEDVLNRLVVIGSHDILLDLIADQMSLSSAHVGSFGGIMSMKRRECHLAPIHLLDEETGTYNISYLQKNFEKGSVALIKGVRRLQGLMVQKNNPLQIHSFSDLIREDVRYVNRQRGAGTRQLLDYELKQRGLETTKINGYKREMTTHMAVAVTISSGGADVGLGIYSAAHAMGLDFIPVGFEEYDFLVPTELSGDPRLQQFIEILQSEAFKIALMQMGGYELVHSGTIIKAGEIYGG